MSDRRPRWSTSVLNCSACRRPVPTCAICPTISQDGRAAVALLGYQGKKWIGAFAAASGGLDDTRNAANDGVISADTSRVSVRVIRTDEERIIAGMVCGVLGLGYTKEN